MNSCITLRLEPATESTMIEPIRIHRWLRNFEAVPTWVVQGDTAGEECAANAASPLQQDGHKIPGQGVSLRRL